MVWCGVIYIMLLKVSVDILKHFALRISQLYEQGAEVGSVRADEDRIGEYVRYWCRWVREGVALHLKPFKVWERRGVFLLHPLLYSFISILSLKTQSLGYFK